MAKSTIIIEAEPGDLIFDIFKQAYNLMTNLDVKKVVIEHNARKFTILQEE